MCESSPNFKKERKLLTLIFGIALKTTSVNRLSNGQFEKPYKRCGETLQML